MDSKAQAPPYAPAYGPNDVGQQHQYSTPSQQQLETHKQQYSATTQPHQPQQMAHHHNVDGQKWRASYCGFCSPFSLCMKTWCCPCFVYGKTKHRLQANGDMTGYDSMNGSVGFLSSPALSIRSLPLEQRNVCLTIHVIQCWLFCGALCCGLTWIPIWLSRSDMRKKHNLEGNGCTDCLSACCCPLCDLVQQEKEAETREAEGQGRPVVNQYQAQGGMAYPAPVQKH